MFRTTILLNYFSTSSKDLIVRNPFREFPETTEEPVTREATVISVKETYRKQSHSLPRRGLDSLYLPGPVPEEQIALPSVTAQCTYTHYSTAQAVVMQAYNG